MLDLTWNPRAATLLFSSLSLPTLASGCGSDSRADTDSDDGIYTLDDGQDADEGEVGEGDDTVGEGDDEGGIKLDTTNFSDIPDQDASPIIPETCTQAEAGESTVGCLFYGVDLDSHDGVETQQFAIVVSNVQESQIATVTVEQKQNGAWSTIAGPQQVSPLDLYTFNLPDLHQDDSGVKVGGAYRVSSDVPIIAYQFNPIDGGSSYLSDASMLYPVPTWDHINHVVGWKVIDEGDVQGAYLTIVAAKDGTEVVVTPSATTLAGTNVPPSPAGVPFAINLDEGDVAEVMTKTMNVGLTGTRVVSDEDHPVAVFSGCECTFIPTNTYACDHLEEQLSGVRLWGQHFIASRVPPRSATDTSLWQIYASEDGTSISINRDAAISGIPADNFVLNAGDVVELYVGGNASTPGDFEVEADKPIAVVNYMTGSENPGAGIGDPAMVQLSPIEQFLPRYVVLVPGTWINDVAVIARPAGATITLDGAAIDDGLFIPVSTSGFEVARVPVSDGIHVFDGDENAFSVVIVGYDEYDSYAYLGGTGTGVINPNPPIG
ncbi:IgGFc-binding protein [Pseudenhygromyxa sp. WMMC2535]|uniref:IgGFc-binding protein n=1 Tax=Pseudenhygromyxa sp. WMMC2535 TaxID=2712867 RepID=UPI001557DD84|nr:IgGFc-binding protein [Pseudenhygromyxa sp. WMMC2535]NVB36750.1 IgGFc-binding protein [Pseudenhygromyxa sp. WMMC2535]